MFDDDYSVVERLWGMVKERFRFIGRLWGFIIPLRIIRRPESLTIFDHRPTLSMFLTVAGIVILFVSFVLLFFKFDTALSYGLWAIGIPAALCVVFLFRSTIREVYYFDKTTDSYTFVRQFIHRKEVIEGSLSQFTGAYVKTQKDDESESHFVVLKQEGMFLTGVAEQTLREELPLFNSFKRESKIATAIAEILPPKG